MASASHPPAHPALQPADRLILPPQQPPAAVETSIGPPHYPAECTQSDAFVQPSLRAREGHANSDSFRRHLAGSKMPKETFFTGSPVGEWSRGARSMPWVFGRGSRSQPAALVSDCDDAALFPAIRILERYGSAKSGRARRVRTACRRRGDPKQLIHDLLSILRASSSSFKSRTEPSSA